MSASLTFLAGPVLAWLADYYLAATLLLLLTLVGLRWVRQPAHRIMAAWTAMLELVVLGVLCGLPFWPRVSLLPAVALEPAAKPAAIAEEGFEQPLLLARDYQLARKMALRMPRVEPAQAEPVVELPADPPPPPPKPWTWTERVALAYVSGAFLIGIWLCWGAVSAAWICRRAKPASASLHEELLRVVQAQQGAPCRKVPRLLVSDRIVNAVAMGVLTPTIVLPTNLAEGGDWQTLRAVLAHEWAHLRNRDLWLLALGRCLLAVFFAHPLFWWLRRAIRGDQELLADAAAAGENRHDYAEELLRLVRRTYRPAPAFSAAVGIWEGSSQLSRRISMLLDDTFRVQPTGSRRWKIQAFTLMTLMGAAVSLITLQPSRSVADQSKDTAAAGSKTGEKANPNGEGFLKPGSDVKIGLPEDGRFIYKSTAEWIMKNDKSYSNSITTEPLTADEAIFGGNIKMTGASAAAPAKENKKDKEKEGGMTVMGDGTLTVSEGNTYVGHTTIIDEASKQLFVVPGFEVLIDQEDAKEFKLTDEQKKKIQEIMTKNSGEYEKFYATRKGMPQERLEKEWRNKWMKQQMATRKLVEELLTPEQMKLVGYISLRQKATYLIGPEIQKQVGLDKDQASKIESAVEEGFEQKRKEEKERNEKKLAILTAEQRGKLREAALGPLGPPQFNMTMVNVEGETKPIQIPTLHPYPDLSEKSAQKSLKLTEEQQKQVRDILGGSATVQERLLKELKKTPAKTEGYVVFGTCTLSGGALFVSNWCAVNDVGSEKQPKGEELEKLKAEAKKKQAELVAKLKAERKKQIEEIEKQPLVKLSRDLRKKLEAVLTPEQLDSYRETAFQAISNWVLDDPIVVDLIGLDFDQCTALQKLTMDAMDGSRKSTREMGEKILKILTPDQQEKLRKAIEEMELNVYGDVGFSGEASGDTATVVVNSDSDQSSSMGHLPKSDGEEKAPVLNSTVGGASGSKAITPMKATEK